MKGRGRIETERFIAMRSHYGFESFFCLPGVKGAHEKGGVEGEVGRFRRRHLVPVPEVASLAELNELVADRRRTRRSPPHRGADVSPSASTSPPSARSCGPLPDEPFDVALQLNCRVDTKSRICVRQSFYSVPVRYAGRRIDVRLGAEHASAASTGRASSPATPGPQAKEPRCSSSTTTSRSSPSSPVPWPGPVRWSHARRSGAFTATHQRFWDLARRTLGDAGRDQGTDRRCCCCIAP